MIVDVFASLTKFPMQDQVNASQVEALLRSLTHGSDAQDGFVNSKCTATPKELAPFQTQTPPAKHWLGEYMRMAALT